MWLTDGDSLMCYIVRISRLIASPSKPYELNTSFSQHMYANLEM